jgi:DNA replication protein DnaC
MKTTEQAKPQEANPQDGPNNNNGPLQEMAAEKEKLRAIKHEADEKLAAIFDDYIKAKEQLPAEPCRKRADLSFSSWLFANHPELYHKGGGGLDEMKRLRNVWRQTKEGRELAEPIEQWQEQRNAIEADYKAARAPHQAAIDEARKRWEEITRVEKSHEADQRKTEKRRGQLRSAIGLELCRPLKIDHPDFDRAAYERYMAWDGWDNGLDGEKNAIIGGPPRLGKTRAMAQKALSLIGPDEDDYNKVEWITAAKFADLVTALGSSEEREAARRHLRRLAEANILFFDDLGAVHFTGPRISHFMTLVDARYAEGWPTHFTTNFSVQQIRDMLLGKGDPADAIVADRIIGRIIGTEAEPRAEVFQFKRRSKPAAKGRKAAAVC